ncbi:glycosyltransferase [Paenibacillus sp. LHD-38]|uniref:glycosyltransferase family 2 protein n=1 Tax=Paenibacillus sp. LHD-38 TaxID=3072143 RepID=UPI0028108316|nr:glycosyltransferase [Paenibacillus sp. LHD-38]MDQ8735746.1 glycosyltransferase [Paenibacillus sp. LHD-38]
MRRIKKKANRLKIKSELQTHANKRIADSNRGLEEGYQQGLEAGFKSFDSYFDGTSIIVTSHNEAERVKRCIESIINYTTLSYEIIVVDNNSTDGIEHYLKQLNGMVRYHILSHNHGFAGALNRGLMMAKGTTILLLSNNVVCTDNWLHNMLICLQSNPSIGIVGAVSNGMNGDQRIDQGYSCMEKMQEFATLNNISDPSSWSTSERLSFQCLLFSRDLLEKVGFLDEGCIERPYVEEDYCIRVRNLGLTLVYAGDAFVHLTSDDEKIPGNEEAEKKKGLLYFTDKWNKPNEVLNSLAHNSGINRTDARQSAEWHERRLGETAFYPQAIAVKGLTETIFWIEDGVRRAIEGIWDGPVIQLSQIDLRRWTFGPALIEDEVQHKLDLVQGRGQHTELHGSICVKADGGMYYMEKGMKRAIVSPLAAEAWFMNSRSQISLLESELLDVPDGLPIIGPIKLRQAL